MDRDARRSQGEALAVLQSAATALDELTDAPEITAAVREVLLSSSGDDEALTAAVTRLSGALSATLDEVNRAKQELERLAAERVEPFSEAWWARRRRDAESGTAVQAARDWVVAYVEALLAGRPDVAQRLCDPSLGLAPADEHELVASARTAADALDEGWLADVVPVARTILDGAWADGLTIDDRVDLEVLLARGMIRSAAPTTEAQVRLERAAASAAKYGYPALESRLVAVQGECALADGDTQTARAEFERAVDIAADEPAGLLGLAMLEEQDARWSKAMLLYDRAAAAVARDVSELERLYAPTTGNFYWRLSRRLSRDPDRAKDALAALDRASELGMAGKAQHQERRAFVDKAHLLERLKRPADAARAYYDAGDRYSQDGDQATARGYLERAISLDGETALYRWALAEVHRLLSQLPDGSVDGASVRAALAEWDRGRALRAPGTDESWVHLVHGMLRHDDVVPGQSERHRVWTSVGDVECALLLDGDSAQSWCFLSLVYLELGLAGCALHAADRARAAAPGDEFAAYVTSRSLAAVGRLDEAMASAADLALAWAVTQTALVHVLQGDPDAALALLDEQSAQGETDPLDPRVRSVALSRAGRDTEAAAAVAHLWTGEGDPEPGDRHTVAWTGYLLGHFDRAAELLQQSLDEGPADPGNQMIDLGLTLLARGGPDDLSRGQVLVSDGVRSCLRWDTLAFLRDADLPALVRRTATSRHSAAIRELAGPLERECVARMGELERADHDAWSEVRDAFQSEQPDDDVVPRHLVARAAMARLAAEAGDVSTALDHYLALTEEGFPETERGVLSSVAVLCQETDDAVRDESPLDEASTQYVRLFGALDETIFAASTDDAVDQPGLDLEAVAHLRNGLALRAALCALLLGQRPDALGWLTAAAAGTTGGTVTDADDARAAVAVFVRDPGGYWAFSDAIAALRDDPGAPPDVVALAAVLAGSASLDTVFHMLRTDIDSVTTFPLENPVSVQLGDDLVPESTGPEWVLFRRLIPDLRERLRERTGITIPGIRFRGGPELGPAQFGILWEQELVASGTASSVPRSSDDPGGIEEVIAALEEVLHENIARLFGPDDLGAWVEELDLDEQELATVNGTLLADWTSRIRTHRVLRLLLREGISLAPGRDVLGALARIEAGERKEILHVAAELRLALADTLFDARAPGTQLPAELEHQVADGLTTDDTDPIDHATVWQVPWPTARDLVADVRTWHGASGAEGGTRPAIVVDDPAVRTYLWRLLAAGGGRTAILTRAELDAAGSPRSRSADELKA